MGKCCGIMLLYTVKIYHSYWFNKMLIVQQPGRKYRQVCTYTIYTILSYQHILIKLAYVISRINIILPYVSYTPGLRLALHRVLYPNYLKQLKNVLLPKCSIQVDLRWSYWYWTVNGSFCLTWSHSHSVSNTQKRILMKTVWPIAQAN